MNYRHAFHAGNFADLLKHAILLGLLQALAGRGRPLRVVDTHAGAGLYDLEDTPTLKSGEAAAGVLRLIAAGRSDDGPLDALRAEVAALNGDGVRLYPGSPVLALRALGPADQLIACELRAEEAARLGEAVGRIRPARGAQVLVRAVDGFGYAAALSSDPSRSTLVLIDPPYEMGDDYDRVIDTTARLLRQAPSPVIAIWAPVKDLETLDALLRRLEAIPGLTGYAAQVRLRPLVNPMRMNGCVMIIVGADETGAAAHQTADAVARLCGEAGAQGFARSLQS